MKLKDYIKNEIFKLKSKKKLIIIKKGSFVKKSKLEGKNSIEKNNYIDNCIIGFGTYFGSENKISYAKIGNYCSIASNISIINGRHPVEKNVSTHPAFYSKFYKKIDLVYTDKIKYNEMKKIDDKWNIVIGNDVWIGNDVKIFQGVTIGNGAVIAAGAIVTKDVEPYSIVGGIPAKLIRKRFSEEIIQYLLNLKWWDKEEKWIKKYSEYFMDVDELINKLNID